MTNERHESGTVFHYPYLWQSAVADGMENPKLRTACLGLKLSSAAGKTRLVILSISDRAPGSPTLAVPVPEMEIVRAGLDLGRRAYVHTDEYNLDLLEGSTHFQPSARIFGRFSKVFTVRIGASLAGNIRQGVAVRVDR